MQLFYAPNLEPNATEFSFDKDESRHMVKVLRKTEGDILQLTNGTGFLFEATLTHAHPKKCIVAINNAEQASPLPYRLHLVVAPTKLNDRYEWFLEKATEIGVTEITPIICDHSERKVIKHERYEKIIISAAKQSLKAYKPILNEASTFNEFMDSETPKGQKFIAHCEETHKRSLKGLLEKERDCTILIGPEGDFSPTEIETAIDQGFIPVSLGNSRLRTETAAIVACHSVAYANEI